MDVQPQPFREHCLRNEQPVRDDDDGRCPQVELLGRAVRLKYADPESLGDILRRWRRLPPAPPGWRVGPRQQRGDLVPLGESLEYVCAERRGRRDRDVRHRAPRTGCGLSFASALRRDSSSVRSMMRTPSR